VVLGFPCNQFKAQEPESEEKIKEFCRLTYGVSFPMFSKIEVNGKNTHPLYAHLKKECPGLLGTGSIKWNFTKFLVNREGKVIKRYATATTPQEIEPDIHKLW
jgi:glutathione peroxidase